MLFWHLGFSIFIFRYVYKDFEADLRYLAGGALLPDFIDFLFNLFGLKIAFNQPGHTLIFAISAMTLVMVVTRRKTEYRKNCLLISIGIFLHLFLDFMWLNQHILFFPLPFDSIETSSRGFLILLVQEIAGFSYLYSKINTLEQADDFFREGKI